LGPVVVNYMHDVRKEAGVPFDQIYSPIFFTLAGMLVVGFIANLLVRPVADKWFMSDAELAEEKRLAHEKSAKDAGVSVTGSAGGLSGFALVAWAAVGIPLAWGVWQTVQKALKLFGGG
jgi:hypothetical protein